MVYFEAVLYPVYYGYVGSSRALSDEKGKSGSMMLNGGCNEEEIRDEFVMRALGLEIKGEGIRSSINRDFDPMYEYMSKFCGFGNNNGFASLCVFFFFFGFWYARMFVH